MSKNNETEEHVTVLFPKKLGEIFLFFDKYRSITEEDIACIMNKIKTEEIKMETLSPLTQSKVKYIQNHKKSQYVMIIPYSNKAEMNEEKIGKEYNLQLFKSKIKRREKLEEFWIYSSDITLYLFLLIKICTTFKGAEPEKRTLSFIQEIGSLHLDSLPEDQKKVSKMTLVPKNEEKEIKKCILFHPFPNIDEDDIYADVDTTANEQNAMNKQYKKRKLIKLSNSALFQNSESEKETTIPEEQQKQEEKSIKSQLLEVNENI